jgi:hypothetical protein
MRKVFPRFHSHSFCEHNQSTQDSLSQEGMEMNTSIEEWGKMDLGQNQAAPDLHTLDCLYSRVFGK